MEFERIDYDCMGQNQAALNDNCAQYMYEETHHNVGFYPNGFGKVENMEEQMETLTNQQGVQYESNGFINSGLLSAESHFEELDFVSFQNPLGLCDNGLTSRIALNHAINKVQDYSNQACSSEDAGFQKYISTGDSSTPSMNHYDMGTPVHTFNMNSPMETTAASTPISSNKGEKGDGQNARRNMPVLIVQKVKQSFLDGMPVSGKKVRSSGGRLSYIYSILHMSVTSENLPAFREFLNSLDFGNKRTWNVIHEQFAGKNTNFINVLLDGIDQFLSEAGAADFQAWVDENKKMKAANKAVLCQSKGWFRQCFGEKFGTNMINFF